MQDSKKITFNVTNFEIQNVRISRKMIALITNVAKKILSNSYSKSLFRNFFEKKIRKIAFINLPLVAE